MLRMACAKVKMGGENHLLTIGGRHLTAYDHLDTVNVLNLDNPIGGSTIVFTVASLIFLSQLSLGWTQLDSSVSPPLSSNGKGLWPARGFVIDKYGNLDEGCDLMFVNFVRNYI